MAVEFVVTLEDRPGTLMELCAVLGAKGVNLNALHGVARGGEGLVHFIADDEERAAAALNSAGIGFARREVLSVRVLGEPGTFADVTRVMYEAGINIDAAYLDANGRVVLGVDDLEGALQVASGLAVLT